MKGAKGNQNDDLKLCCIAKTVEAHNIFNAIYHLGREKKKHVFIAQGVQL